MKIALVSPIEETVPPILYGGIEWVVYYLAKILSEKKHDVYLLTTKNSPKIDVFQSNTQGFRCFI